MELKDFVKGVLADLTNAIKESQEELNNGAIVSPTGIDTKDASIKTKDGYLYVSHIEFEISVSASSTNSTNGGITVLSAITGGIEGKSVDENVSKIRFSIPLIFPSTMVSSLPRNASYQVR